MNAHEHENERVCSILRFSKIKNYFSVLSNRLLSPLNPEHLVRTEKTYVNFKNLDLHIVGSV